MLQPLLTIFTPTYNRAYTLPRLYESLCRQTNSNFIWSIVDDGSSDNTKDLVSQWQNEDKVNITYVYQPNGGKMRAHNRGVKDCSTELFFCVDSDDYLEDDAVASIYTEWDRVGNNPTIAGLVAYKAFPHIICEFPQQPSITMFNLLATGFKGDTSLVYRTEILRQHLFPEIEGEKFIGEDYVYNQIDREFQLSIFRKILTQCTYYEDGYSCNWNKLYMANPKGWALYYDQKSTFYPLSKHRMVYVAYYIAFCWIGHNHHIIRNSAKPWLTFLCLPLGVQHYFRKKKLYSK